jgi:DNA-binding transcriptional MerR regulator
LAGTLGNAMPKDPSSQKDESSDASVMPTYEWVERSEAASIAGVNERTFRRWEQQDPIPHTKHEGKGPGAKKLYRRDLLDEWLENHQVEKDQSDLLASTAAVMRAAAQASNDVHKAAAVALKAGADSIKDANDRTNILLSSLTAELDRTRTHTSNLEGRVVEAWDLIAAMHDERKEQIIKAARDQAEQIVSNERSKFMFESARLAWPGILHKLVPSQVTEHAIFANVFRIMPGIARAKFMALVDEYLPGEAKVALGSLLAPVLEELAKEESAKETKEKGPTTAK